MHEATIPRLIGYASRNTSPVHLKRSAHIETIRTV